MCRTHVMTIIEPWVTLGSRPVAMTVPGADEVKYVLLKTAYQLIIQRAKHSCEITGSWKVSITGCNGRACWVTLTPVGGGGGAVGPWNVIEATPKAAQVMQVPTTAGVAEAQAALMAVA